MSGWRVAIISVIPMHTNLPTRNAGGSSGSSRHDRVVACPSISSTQLRFAGDSPAVRALLRQVERIAPFDHAPVLLEGESGTGKSYVARYVHASSPRSRAPFHQVLLSALDDNLASSDLFGHLSGAYTDARQNRPGHFVAANGGTLFLDEIGKASPAVQRKLLHAVEHNEVWPVGADRAVRLDVRLVAATNVPMQELVDRGSFLPDLAARFLNFTVRLPSLAERRQDIPELVEQFVAVRGPRCGHPRLPRISAGLMDLLVKAEWPNNLRQLDGVVQRLLMEAVDASVVTVDHCVDGLAWLRQEPSPAAVSGSITPELVRARFDDLRSVVKTARSLGVSRWTVYRYLERTRDEARPGESSAFDS